MPWETKFVNVWKMAIRPDGEKLAAEVRLNLYDYTIAVNGRAWEKTFDCVWEPIFNPRSGGVLAPIPVLHQRSGVGAPWRPNRGSSRSIASHGGDIA